MATSSAVFTDDDVDDDVRSAHTHVKKLTFYKVKWRPPQSVYPK